MDTFEARVKKTRLTKSNRMIAEYCLNNQSSIAFQSTAELANNIGVSDVSIIRFARALGYDGFVDMKHAWQEELCQIIDADASSINPVSKFLTRKTYNRDTSNFQFAEAEATYVSLIHETLASNQPAVITQAADALCRSRVKYIVGIRTRGTAAAAMATLLRMALPDVRSITTEDYAAFMKLQDFQKEDCVIFFTFGRFSQFEQSLLERVKESGAFLITITDKRASKAALAADLLIFCAGDINLPFYSSAGTVILSECIANAVAEKNWEESELRIQQSEKYLNKLGPKR